ncbi:MAG TPA: hypothetical protein VD767_09285, partial [Thermomicrobiales bacterium]|nr:hypothetical protein [Thermomicrobiales bacterium]
MQPLSDALQSGILSRQAVGVALIAAIGVFLIVNRSLIAEILRDPARGWRLVARAGGAVGAITLIWITVFDDWLQLVVEPYRLSMKWDYQRVQYDPIDPAIRAITLGLAAASMLLLGFLV